MLCPVCTWCDALDCSVSVVGAMLCDGFVRVRVDGQVKVIFLEMLRHHHVVFAIFKADGDAAVLITRPQRVIVLACLVGSCSNNLCRCNTRFVPVVSVPCMCRGCQVLSTVSVGVVVAVRSTGLWQLVTLCLW